MFQPRGISQSIDITGTKTTLSPVCNKSKIQFGSTAQTVTPRSALSKKEARAKTTKVKKINFHAKSKLNHHIFYLKQKD